MTPSPEEYARLEKLFSQALDLPPSERPAFIDKVRQEYGPAMADDLNALLVASADQTIPMDAPAALLSNRSFQDGELILNRFRIIRELGHGGMGEVYEALDSEMGPVALKTIRGDVTFNNSLLLRFKQEVQLARRVTSQHVCRIHEFFTLPATNLRPPVAFLTMELLNGTTLTDRIANHGPLSWHDAEPIALQLCQGLQAIHAARIIHRDFKPRNIMLATNNGGLRVVIMDLGLAHQLPPADTSPSGHSLTIAGTVMGTQDYMAPEQFEDGPISPATDIYSFGIVLYEMLTGKLPWTASSLIAAASRRAKRPPPASSIQPGVPTRVSKVIEKCLAYDSGERYQSAPDLATALQNPFRQTSTALNAIKPARPRLLLAGLLALACLLIGYRTYRTWNAHKIPAPAQHYYADATSSFNKGNYLTASRQLKKATELDPDFVLAHARLADAYNELDFTGEAQREVNQIKQDLVTQLPATDQTYIEAVRDTVRPDPTSALSRYQKLLSKASTNDDKSAALTDLARADERAGKIPEAIQNYGQAIQLNPNSPAPYVRRGILQSRQGHQGHQKEADTDFATADQIYSTGINLEGQAEVAYQKSYVASKLGPEHDTEARTAILSSLDAATRMKSFALQARAYSRLSAIENNAHHPDLAEKAATEATRRAGLDPDDAAYWSTDARVRLANSLSGHDATRADTLLQQARLDSEHHQWPRLLALTQVSLAAMEVEDQTTAKQQEVIDIAASAASYYRTFGFAQEWSQCQLLISRAKRFFGQFKESFDYASSALEATRRMNSAEDLIQVLEYMGTALLLGEDYTAALQRFSSALHLAESLPDSADKVSYLATETLLYCEALIGLGHSDEASQKLNAPAAVVSADPLDFALLQAESLNTQGRYPEALRVLNIWSTQNLSHEDRWDLNMKLAEAHMHIGHSSTTFQLCDQVLAAGGAQNPVTIATAKLVKARALLLSKRWLPSRSLAEDASHVFAASGQLKSLLLSTAVIASSYRQTGPASEATSSAKKVRDILVTLEHNYGTADYNLFVRRSDIAEIASGI